MNFIRVVHLGKIVLIKLGDVRYFLSRNKYTEVHVTGHVYYFEDSLVKLESLLPEFVRIHRNCLVDAARVVAIKRIPSTSRFAKNTQHFVVLEDNQELEISRRYVKSVKQWAKDHDLLILRGARVQNVAETSQTQQKSKPTYDCGEFGPTTATDRATAVRYADTAGISCD